jgi:hypothetical protein
MIPCSLLRLSILMIGNLVLALGSVLLCGCSEPGPKRYAISGEVTLDGSPVNQATIVFTPKDAGLAAAASIFDGQFSLPADAGPTQGEFGVRINPLEAELDESQHLPAQLSRLDRRPRIPKHYQQNGTLTAIVTGEPNQSLRFELVSRPH